MSLNVKETVVQDVAFDLLDRFTLASCQLTTDNQQMVCPCHPLTPRVMELMATGFDPPLTNEVTTEACLDIYERRFVSTDSPEPIAQNIVAYRVVVAGIPG